MLEYDKIDMSKGIDVNETKSSRECIKYHSWYFLKVNFRFQPKVCDGSHVLMQKALCFNNVAIVSVKGNNYRIVGT